MMSFLNTSDLEFLEKVPHVPQVDEVIQILNSGLKTNFENVEVQHIDCPDLTSAPYYLADSGFGGNPVILEIGGAPYLLPLVQRSKLYDLKEICNHIYSKQNIKKYFAVGAGAGPWPHVNINCEGMYNMKVENNSVTNESHLALVDKNLECELQKIPNSVTALALLGNILVTEGKPGKVINVKCSKRIGEENFISSIRTSLAEFYTDKTVTLGGMFVMKKGLAKQHIMQDFSTTPIHTDDELNTWLKFYEMEAPLIAMGTLVTDEADLDLRLQHFHSFSKHGQGGHYHYDTTPDVVEYEGFFVIGEKIVRVDRPVDTHKMGRD